MWTRGTLLTCLVLGTWLLLSAEGQSCGTPPAPPDNSIRAVHPTKEYFANGRAIYQCTCGHILPGNVPRAVVRCKARPKNGKTYWRRVPKCDPVPCTADPPEGTNTEAVVPKGTYRYKDVYIYTCKSGFKQVDGRTPTSVCMADGDWSAAPNCEPDPCQLNSVLDFNEAFRKDTGGNLKPNNGHYHTDNTTFGSWFRITGDAGGRIRDTCPPNFSCGALYMAWTDGEVPEAVGEVGLLPLYFIDSTEEEGSPCPGKNDWDLNDPTPLTAVRCSSATNDLVYRIADYEYNDGVCTTD